MIRPAVAGDAPAILAIHENIVANTYAVWRDEPMSLREVEGWLEAHARRGFPFLVAERDGGGVIAYATFGPFRGVSGYNSTVENAVHVAPDFRGGGLGTALMLQLIARAQELGLHAMVAAIDSENLGSIRLHEKLGFTVVGVMPEIAKKFGQWRALTLMQRRL